MLHLTKLAVGARDVEHLRALQVRQLEAGPPLRHRTRNCPRRAAELVEGGSIYWVVSGRMSVRQRIMDIVDDTWDDGGRCSALILEPALVPVASRPTKPFQGWRYLSPDDAPPDIAPARAGDGEGAMPTALREALRGLCLI